MESKQTGSNNWFQELVGRCNGLSEQFGLDDVHTSDLRTFVVDLAREQYKRGNSAGARWAFAQAQKGKVEQPA